MRITAIVIITVALASPAAAQVEVAVGPMFGLQDLERPVTPGWIVSSGFEIGGGQTLVVEGSWHRDSYTRDHLWDYDEIFRERSKSRYWMLAGGIRSKVPRGRVGLYYQLLAGGFSAGYRTDNEWPASIDVEAENAACGAYINGELLYPCENVPFPAFREDYTAGFVMQPGAGVGREHLAATHAPHGGRRADPRRRRVRHHASQGFGPGRRRAGALTSTCNR